MPHLHTLFPPDSDTHCSLSRALHSDGWEGQHSELTMKTHSLLSPAPSALREGPVCPGAFKLSGNRSRPSPRSSWELRPSCKVLLLAWPSLSAKQASPQRSN